MYIILYRGIESRNIYFVIARDLPGRSVHVFERENARQNWSAKESQES